MQLRDHFEVLLLLFFLFFGILFLLPLAFDLEQHILQSHWLGVGIDGSYKTLAAAKYEALLWAFSNPHTIMDVGFQE